MSTVFTCIWLFQTKGGKVSGHLKEGAIVHPTAEIVIGEDEAAIYTRELDEKTGFAELVINQR